MSDIRVNVASSTRNRQTNDNVFRTLDGSRAGELYVMDWKQAAMNEGRAYLLQLGTEDAPIASTAAIDDTLVWAVVDVPTNLTVYLYAAQARVGTWTTSTLVNMMIEIDNAQTRYSSGGTAFTPLCLRTDNPLNGSDVTAVVGTDVTVDAKTSGGSLEVYRQSIEVNWGNAGDGYVPFDYVPDPIECVVGPASILFHLGATTADVTAYGFMKWIEVPSSSIT